MSFETSYIATVIESITKPCRTCHDRAAELKKRATTSASTSTATNSQLKCTWSGHCLGDPCTGYDFCDRDWVCVSSVCATVGALSTTVLSSSVAGSSTIEAASSSRPSGCAWPGHCIGAICKSADECVSNYECQNGKCALPSILPSSTSLSSPLPSGCNWPGHCVGAKCNTADDCASNYFCVSNVCASSAAASSTATSTGSSSHSLNTPTAIGIGVAIPTTVAVVAGIGFFIWRHRRRKRREAKEAAERDARDQFGRVELDAAGKPIGGDQKGANDKPPVELHDDGPLAELSGETRPAEMQAIELVELPGDAMMYPDKPLDTSKSPLLDQKLAQENPQSSVPPTPTSIPPSEPLISPETTSPPDLRNSPVSEFSPSGTLTNRPVRRFQEVMPDVEGQQQTQPPSASEGSAFSTYQFWRWPSRRSRK